MLTVLSVFRVALIGYFLYSVNHNFMYIFIVYIATEAIGNYIQELNAQKQLEQYTNIVKNLKSKSEDKERDGE